MDLSKLSRTLRDLFARIGQPSGFPDEWQLAADLHVDESGWLEGDRVVQIRSHSSWFYPELSTASGDPGAIVWHASATPHGSAGNMARRRAVPRSPADRAASWHISVEGNGDIVQMIPAECGAWHAIGKISGLGPANRTSASIEIIGFERGPFPEAQVVGCARVARALVRSYGIPRSLANVSHASIDPDRRTDPGKLWLRDHAPHVMEYAFT